MVHEGTDCFLLAENAPQNATPSLALGFGVKKTGSSPARSLSVFSETALDLVRRFEPQLVFSAVGLPNVSGLEPSLLNPSACPNALYVANGSARRTIGPQEQKRGKQNNHADAGEYDHDQRLNNDGGSARRVRSHRQYMPKGEGESNCRERIPDCAHKRGQASIKPRRLCDHTEAFHQRAPPFVLHFPCGGDEGYLFEIASQFLTNTRDLHALKCCM